MATLRLDLSDPEDALFSDEVLTRCLHKGVHRLARDLDIRLTVIDGEVDPEPDGDVGELLLLLGQVHACQYMRASTANAFVFSSGDKRVDKTKQPEHWAKLEQDLMTQYRLSLNEARPGGAVLGRDDYILSPDLKPVIYEQGANL